MKKIKFIAVFLLIACVTVLFVACNKDEEIVYTVDAEQWNAAFTSEKAMSITNAKLEMCYNGETETNLACISMNGNSEMYVAYHAEGKVENIVSEQYTDSKYWVFYEENGYQLYSWEKTDGVVVDDGFEEYDEPLDEDEPYTEVGMYIYYLFEPIKDYSFENVSFDEATNSYSLTIPNEEDETEPTTVIIKFINGELNSIVYYYEGGTTFYRLTIGGVAPIAKPTVG